MTSPRAANYSGLQAHPSGLTEVWADTARHTEIVDGHAAGRGAVLSMALAETAVSAAKERFGRIDVLVNNAGYGQLGWFENNSEEQVRHQFEVIVFGAMSGTRAVLPLMRAQRSGHILTVSSIAGLVSGPSSSIYASSKFALEGWMEGLAGELKPLGIKVTILEPGFFRTDFLDPSSVKYGAFDIAEYAEASAKVRVENEQINHCQVGDPAKFGALLLKVSDLAESPLRLAAGSDGVEWATAKGKSLHAEAEKWRHLSTSTDGDKSASKPSSPPPIVSSSNI